MDNTQTAIAGDVLISGPATLQWHEALALVLQVADTIEQARTTFVPDLPCVQLLPDGTIAITPGFGQSGQPVARLAAMLRALLQDAATPPELAGLVTQAAEQPWLDQNVGRFVNRLHFFERPDRAAVLRGVVQRFAASSEDARIAQEVGRLVAKAREAASAPTSSGTRPLQRGRTRAARAAVAVVALVALVVVAATFWWLSRPLFSHAGGSLVAGMGQTATQAFNGSELPAPQPAAASPVRTSPRTTRGTAGHIQRSGRYQTMSKQPDVSRPPTAGTVVANRDADSRVATIHLSDGEPGRIYSSLDPGVTPPVALQPSIGRVTTDANRIAGDMEILVGPTGSVERVMLAIPNNYQDRWLIYAVKNRLFKPAVANGHPVRYLLHVRTAD